MWLVPSEDVPLDHLFGTPINFDFQLFFLDPQFFLCNRKFEISISSFFFPLVTMDFSSTSKAMASCNHHEHFGRSQHLYVMTGPPREAAGNTQRKSDNCLVDGYISLGIQSPKLRMVMGSKYLPCWGGDYTPQSSSDKMIRSLGYVESTSWQPKTEGRWGLLLRCLCFLCGHDFLFGGTGFGKKRWCH